MCVYIYIYIHHPKLSILYMIAHARVLLMIERGCYALCVLLPESARPGHIVSLILTTCVS